MINESKYFSNINAKFIIQDYIKGYMYQQWSNLLELLVKQFFQQRAFTLTWMIELS